MHFTHFIKDKIREISKLPLEIDIKFSWDTNSPIPTTRYVIYQLEQLSVRGKLNPRYVDLMNNSETIFEYSTENYKYYDKNLITKVKFLPYFPKKCNIPSNKTYNIDVLFYGYLSGRRVEILNKLKNKGYSLETHHNLTLEEMKQKINQSKYILSYGTYSNDYNDSFRVSFALELGANILYEKTKEDWYDNYIMDHFADRITLI